MSEVEITPGVKKTILKEAPPGAQSVQKYNKVHVHCTGYLKDGLKKFWSTHDSGNTFSFQVGIGQVISGWDDGCLSMKVGESARFSLSANKAYGQSGFPAWGIPANAPLVFDIEVVSVQ